MIYSERKEKNVSLCKPAAFSVLETVHADVTADLNRAETYPNLIKPVCFNNPPRSSVCAFLTLASGFETSFQYVRETTLSAVGVGGEGWKLITRELEAHHL